MITSIVILVAIGLVSSRTRPVLLRSVSLLASVVAGMLLLIVAIGSGGSRRGY